MTYDDVRAFAGLAGLFLFMGLFIGVLIYTFWPGNKKRFERARHIPLDEDPKDQPPRGDNGRE